MAKRKQRERVFPGLPWYRLDMDFIGAKAPAIAGRLGIPTTTAIGMGMLCFKAAVDWTWSDEAPPSGELPEPNAGDRLEMAMLWSGDRGRAVEAFTLAGVFEPLGAGVRVKGVPDRYRSTWQKYRRKWGGGGKADADLDGPDAELLGEDPARSGPVSGPVADRARSGSGSLEVDRGGGGKERRARARSVSPSDPENISPPPPHGGAGEAAGTEPARAAWARVLGALEADGKRYALTWLSRIVGLEVREERLVLAVPDRFFREWVADHYGQMLAEAVPAAAGLAGYDFEVRPDVFPEVPEASPQEPARPLYDASTEDGCWQLVQSIRMRFGLAREVRPGNWKAWHRKVVLPLPDVTVQVTNGYERFLRDVASGALSSSAILVFMSERVCLQRFSAA